MSMTTCEKCCIYIDTDYPESAIFSEKWNGFLCEQCDEEEIREKMRLDEKVKSETPRRSEGS